MSKTIGLTQGFETIVDDQDFEWLSKSKWYTKRGRKLFYARHKERGKKHQKEVLMHRLILNAPQGMQVDHINGDGLDNRRSNLRLATNSQNLKNQGPHKDNCSGFKGVYWDKRAHKWRAQIRTDGKKTGLGYFTLKEDAARAYNDAASKAHGTFAWLNKIPG